METTKYKSATSIGNITIFFTIRAVTNAQKEFPYNIFNQTGVKHILINKTITIRAAKQRFQEILDTL